GHGDRPRDRLPEDERQLDLEVEQLPMRRPDERPDRGADQGVRLLEEHLEALRVRVEARLDHVLTIVGAKLAPRQITRAGAVTGESSVTSTRSQRRGVRGGRPPLP